ncbi:MAG: VOC family protein, partial [Polyangiaceae bacterium]
MASTNIGRFVWYEFMTSDTAPAIAFYTNVIGWKTQPWDNGYTMWTASQGPLGGTMKLDEEAKKMGARPSWMSHVEVANVDATVAAARKHEARVHVEPTDIPKIGRFAMIADPQGAMISVFTPSDPM